MITLLAIPRSRPNSLKKRRFIRYGDKYPRVVGESSCATDCIPSFPVPFAYRSSRKRYNDFLICSDRLIDIAICYENHPSFSFSCMFFLRFFCSFYICFTHSVDIVRDIFILNMYSFRGESSRAHWSLASLASGTLIQSTGLGERKGEKQGFSLSSWLYIGLSMLLLSLSLSSSLLFVHLIIAHHSQIVRTIFA